MVLGRWLWFMILSTAFLLWKSQDFSWPGLFNLYKNWNCLKNKYPIWIFLSYEDKLLKNMYFFMVLQFSIIKDSNVLLLDFYYIDWIHLISLNYLLKIVLWITFMDLCPWCVYLSKKMFETKLNALCSFTLNRICVYYNEVHAN